MDESVDYLEKASTAPGSRLGSKYVVGELLGRGAMGVVHAGETIEGRPVAIKFLRAELAADHKTVARFLQERHIFRKIDHTNVVKVHDLVAEGDAVAIVMERVPGGDLKRRVDTGALTARQAMAVAADVAAGLDAIHRVNVIHRDLKPANILLTDQLVPKISDFGISRLVTEAMSRTSSTIGTPIYMAPEAADQRGAEGPSDVYALGVMMFEMLVGRAPFAEGGTFAILRAHAMDAPPRVDGVPVGLSNLIDRMLAKDPAGRPQADQVRRALLDLLPEIDDYLRPEAVPRANTDGLTSSQVTGPRDDGTRTIAGYDQPSPAGPAAAAGPAVGAIAAGALGPADSAETIIGNGPANPAPIASAVAGAAGAPGFAGLQGSFAANGAPPPPAFDHTRAGFGAPATSLLPRRLNRRTIEVLVAAGTLLAVIAVAAFVLASGGDDNVEGIGSGDDQVSVEAAGPGASQLGGTNDDDDGAENFSQFGNPDGALGDESSSSDSDSDSDAGRTETTDGPTTRTTESPTDSSTATTEPTATSTPPTPSSTDAPSTTEQPTTSLSTTSTTEATTSTVSSTTSSTVDSQPIQILSGSTSYDSVGPNQFHFSFKTNDVCGTGSFSVYEQATNTLVGSFSGANVCYGPVHGGFPGHSSFPGFNLQPNTTYRVAITVKGTASDGSRTAGSGQASTSLLITTSS